MRKNKLRLRSVAVIQDDYYRDNYQAILNEGSIGIVSNLVHKTMEAGIHRRNYPKVLELGAGKGQHLKFVKHTFEKYWETDVRLENLPQRDNLTPSANFLTITQQVDAQDLSGFEDSSFDRIVATCLLIHLPDPEKALIEWKRVIKPGGLITIYIPCEPGLILRSLRYLTTVRKAKKLNLDHLGFHYREHVTYFVRLWILISSVFKGSNIKKTYYPFRIPSWNLNLWVIVQIQVKK